jgi:hypothetical protein
MTETQFDTEDWKQYKREVQSRKAIKRERRTKYILDLKNKGYEIEMFTEYHFRIKKPGSNAILDLYPTSAKYHILNTGKGGRFKNITRFVNKIFNN